VPVVRPNLPEAIKALDQLDSLQISPRLLKDNSPLVKGVRKLKHYTGPKICPEDTEEQKV